MYIMGDNIFYCFIVIKVGNCLKLTNPLVSNQTQGGCFMTKVAWGMG